MNNKVSNSRDRLLEVMKFYGLSQTELCKRTGIQKSALSNYINGYREPRQNQISLVADAFGLNPAWLMGYDVPMFLNEVKAKDDDVDALLIREMYKHFTPEELDDPELVKQIMSFMDFLKKLDAQGRDALLTFARTLKF